MRFGYFLVIASVLLMIWISLSGAAEVIRHPPCQFNAFCTCSKNDQNLGIVQCRNVQLLRMPTVISMSTVYTLQLENNGLRELQPRFLQKTGISRLEISHNSIYELDKDVFDGLERTLRDLVLENNDFTEIPLNALDFLQRLKTLDLKGNDIREVGVISWGDLRNSLETLILADNSIKSLTVNTFRGLAMLETLDLRGNFIKNIDSVFRDGVPKLRNLSLGSNQLDFIPYNEIRQLRYLESLDVSNNNITAIEEVENNQQVVSKLSLKQLDLNFNDIKILPKEAFRYFQNINFTILDGNPIQIIEDNAFHGVIIHNLLLRLCGLRDISPFAFFGLESSLQFLDLRGNQFYYSVDLFSNFEELQVVYLETSPLEEFSVEILNGLEDTMISLDISGRGNGQIRLDQFAYFRKLRSLSLANINLISLNQKDFIDYSVDLQHLSLKAANLKVIGANAFDHAHGLKVLDLSENNIGTIEKDSFQEIGHSLKILIMFNAFASWVDKVPDSFRPLYSLETLDLRNNHFRLIPQTALHSMRKLKMLLLDDNKIERISKGIFKSDFHQRLQEIHLTFNALKYIDQFVFLDLPQLSGLFLSDNLIERLERKAFMNLENLKVLSLKGNRITSIVDETFGNLPRLELLDLSFNFLRFFDFAMFDQVGTLATLSVNVSNNVITDLIRNSANKGQNLQANIEILDLSNNQIVNIGPQFFQAVENSLLHLNLRNNRLDNVTWHVFGTMFQLKSLDLSKNGIQWIDVTAFTSTTKLQVLNLSGNKIEKLGLYVLKNLVNLRTADLSNNQLQSLPDFLILSERIESLDLSNNSLKLMHLDSFAEGAQHSLCELKLSGNQITALDNPDLLKKFISLIKLDLSRNPLIYIYENLAKFPKLAVLDLSHNKDMELEPQGRNFHRLGRTLVSLSLDNITLSQAPMLPLPRLQHISLSNNNLPSLPYDLTSNMSSLRSVDLSHNDFTTVPDAVRSLLNAKKLSLAGNPITILTPTSFGRTGNSLEELDIRDFSLESMEEGILDSMDTLRKLYMNSYTGYNPKRISEIVKSNVALQSLHIKVDKDTDLSLEMSGTFPRNLRYLTLSGKKLKFLSDYALKGITNPYFYLTITDSNLQKLSNRVFQNMEKVDKFSLDLRQNNFHYLESPSTANRPGVLEPPFLVDLKIEGNKWICDCDLGWIETWERKSKSSEYRCVLPTKISVFPKVEDYACLMPDDDLRLAQCVNKGNRSVLNVLKEDLECEWRSSATQKRATVLLVTVVVNYLTIIY